MDFVGHVEQDRPQSRLTVESTSATSLNVSKSTAGILLALTALLFLYR